MANELGLKLNLKYKKNDRTFSINEESSITVAGDDYTFQRQSIGTTYETIDVPFIDIATKGYMYIKNRDSANFVLIGTCTYKLDYDNQTVNFSTGVKVTGGTSGATGWIVNDEDGGASGTLILSNVIGTFQNNELLTDSVAGSANVDGTKALSLPAYFLKLKAGEFAVFRVNAEDRINAVADTSACNIEYFIIED